MKKDKKSVKKKMNPDPAALEGIPAHDPHADFVSKDENFKSSRGNKK